MMGYKISLCAKFWVDFLCMIPCCWYHGRKSEDLRGHSTNLALSGQHCSKRSLCCRTCPVSKKFSEKSPKGCSYYQMWFLAKPSGSLLRTSGGFFSHFRNPFQLSSNALMTFRYTRSRNTDNPIGAFTRPLKLRYLLDYSVGKLTKIHLPH